ncbi:MAG: hypothetical protein JXR48_16075 [Candidatus Delongbacteria bacterium]|nr:hypothetical protein [Candidatus Delongbacteria bacterium]MBN2836476.1 hypothetical protein [Candidatus Delongbacteria bacterium]
MDIEEYKKKYKVKGAGGTEGGIGRFFIGLIMMIAGTYLLLNSITITNSFSFGMRLYSYGNYGVTSGYMLVPFIFGIGIMFYNSKNVFGWLLTFGSMVMIVFGVITSTQFRLQHMSMFELITILVLMVGGIGLFFSSFRRLSKQFPDE